MGTVKLEHEESSVAEGVVVEEDNDQYLTFIMDKEEYGVDILCVQEIRGWDSATPLPNAPPHIKGVINLRGTIVPIVDLRQCFGMQGISYTNMTVVIVLRVECQDKQRIMGIVVDAVSDVYTLKKSDMKEAPDLGEAVNTSFIKGLVNVNEKMVILLNIAQLLTLDSMPHITDINTELLQASVLSAENQAHADVRAGIN